MWCKGERKHSLGSIYRGNVADFLLSLKDSSCAFWRLNDSHVNLVFETAQACEKGCEIRFVFCNK